MFDFIRAEWHLNKNNGMGVIFIDECDQVWEKMELINQEDQKIKDILNAFKAEITSLRNHCPHNPDAFIFVIGPTNHLDQIDDAIKSRLNYHIEFKPLDTNGRKKFLEFLIEKRKTPITSTAKEYLLTTINDALEKLTDKSKTGQRTMEYLLDDAIINARYETQGQSDIRIEDLKKSFKVIYGFDLP
ncbi:AAA family ATPase [Candidatus Phytoplasma asteris]|uniref:AAA family ATPase n=1 Tax=Candidatus Phytoplasma asteris TaxID=85620 RepID=UPI0039E0C721